MYDLLNQAQDSNLAKESAYRLCFFRYSQYCYLQYSDGAFNTHFFLKLIDTPADTLADSILYLRIYFLGISGTLIFNIGSAIMRSIGDSRRPLYYLIVCCFLNIILDLVLVIVFDMGIVGAAIATIISQAVSAILVTNALMKKIMMTASFI